MTEEMPRNEILESFIRDQGGAVFRSAYRLAGGNVEKARDLVQESLCRAVSRWRQYDQSMPLSNWFFTIMRNLSCDWSKRKSAKTTVSLDAMNNEKNETPLADGVPGPLEDLERMETVSLVRRGIGRLNPIHREALSLYMERTGTCGGMAAHAGICPATIRSRMCRARKALRAALLGLNGGDAYLEGNQ